MCSLSSDEKANVDFFNSSSNDLYNHFCNGKSAYSQNATKGENACMSCGPITGTNLTNATKGGNVTNAIISLNDAKRIITAAEKKAVDIGQPMNIAVVDFGGNPYSS